MLHYQTLWRGGGRKTLKFHFPPAEGKGLGLLFSLSLSFSFAPLLSFSFHPHACAEDGNVCVCVCFARESVHVLSVSEYNAYKERARGSCSVEGDCFGEEPSCSLSEDFLYTEGKGRLYRPCKMFTSNKLRHAGWRISNF